MTKTIDRGRVLTGFRVVGFTPPSPQKWAELEAAFGGQLPQQLRRDLNLVMIVYVKLAACFETSKTRSDVKRRLLKWRKDTVALREFVWSDPVELSENTDINSSTHINSSTYINSSYPLASFADTLDSAIASVDAVFAVLKQLPSNTPKPAFAVWLVLVRHFFNQYGIRTTAASGDKIASDSPFVRFLAKFQECLGIPYLYGPAYTSKIRAEV